MCAYIGIEDLAANALIEILDKEKDCPTKFVSYSKLEKYGLEVVKLLINNGEEAVLILSRDDTRKMLRNYSDIFCESEQEGEVGIQLKENVTVNMLIEKFRGYLSLEVLLAFMKDSAVKVLWE